jgi:hypothetical protein
VEDEDAEEHVNDSEKGVSSPGRAGRPMHLLVLLASRVAYLCAICNNWPVRGGQEAATASLRSRPLAEFECGDLSVSSSTFSEETHG